MNGLDVIRTANPYLEPLGEFINAQDWAAVLLVDPLEGVDRQGLTEFERRMLLKQSRTRFEPTAVAIAVISRLQDMIWNRYVLWNPLLPVNRFRTVQTLAQRGKPQSSAPWLPDFADAMLLMGCTGTGKSTILSRYFKLIAQVHIHTARDDAEWTRQAQLTYLVVAMPVHRGALFYAILAAIDTALGTNYRTTYGDHRRWPIEKLAVEVAIILVQHAVGVLVIEEIQARNFGMSPNKEEMLLFFLRVLNFGIPVVLVGNPLGFVGLETFSQDLNRLTENEPVHLVPPEVNHDEWTTGLGPGMWSHNVMPNGTPWSTVIGAELHACSAAFPGYVRKAVDGMQLLALGDGARAVDLSHLARYATESLAMEMNRDLIDGFAMRDPFKLMAFLDVPWEYYGVKWGKLDVESIAGAPDSDRAADEDIDEDEKASLQSIHRAIRAAAKSQLTRVANRSKANGSRTRPPAQDDLRNPASDALAAGLAELRKRAAEGGH